MNRKVTAVAAMFLAGGVTLARVAGAQETNSETRTSHGAMREHTRKMVGNIESINKKDRTVTVADDQGQKMTINVPENAGDLDRIKVGERVSLTYTESLALSLHKPGEAAPKAETKESTQQMPGGAGMGPGRAMTRQTTVTAEVVAVDPHKHQVTLKGPQGNMQTIDVKDAELRKRLSDIHPGDTVEATYTEAVAASLVPSESKSEKK